MTTPAAPESSEHRATSGGGKRILGMKPMTAYFVFGGVLLTGITAYLIKQHQASKAAATSADTTGTSTGASATGIDYSGELSAIQTELEALQQQYAAVNSTVPASPPGGTGGTGSGSSTPSAPTGGHVTSLSNNDAEIEWNANGASKWNTKIVGPGGNNGHVSLVTEPRASYSGLSAGHNYEVTVTPLSASGTPGPSGVVHFKTKK